MLDDRSLGALLRGAQGSGSRHQRGFVLGAALARRSEQGEGEAMPWTTGDSRKPIDAGSESPVADWADLPGRIVTERRRSDGALTAAATTCGGVMLQPGTRLGAFVIVWNMGVGGQAGNYLALGSGLRRVALKVAHPGAEAALHDEHAWLSRPGARHRHLAQLAPYAAQDTVGISIGRAGVRHTWIALAYAPGRALADLLRRRRLRSDQALLVACQAAQALDHLHRAVGVVHQDVTPANLIVRCGWNGAIHTTLIDLGSAAAPEDPRRRACYGADPYIAPERLRDPSAPPDPQSDVFALGIVIQHLLANHAPLADLADLIAAMTHPAITQRRAAVPTMGAVVARLEGIYRRHTRV
jgi:hypothetical protein